MIETSHVMNFCTVDKTNSIYCLFLQASFALRKSLTQSVEKIRSQMSETATAVDEPDATLVTEFVYNETNSEKKSWKFCNNVTLPSPEIVFVAQMLVIVILLTCCILKFSVTKLSCEETSVWFSILSGLVGYVLLNLRI